MSHWTAQTLLGLSLAFFVAAGPVGAAPCSTTWSAVKTPMVGTSANLSGVATIDTANAWSVGTYRSSPSGPLLTLTEHWNGSLWTVVPSPSPSSAFDNVLSGIAAISAQNTWAVGYQKPTLEETDTLTVHWDGIAWSVVSSQDPPGATVSVLRGISATGEDDAWAVGYTIVGGAQETLIEHWDGLEWSIVASPNGDLLNELSAVAAIGPNDVWAVGDFNTCNGGCGTRTLTEHWDGSNWNIVSSPNRKVGDLLYGVSALSSIDVWAVGRSGGPKTLTEHWDGSQWSIVSSPNAGSYDNYLYGVMAVSSQDVWAVGYYIKIAGEVDATLIERWSGSTWSIVASPNPGRSFNALVSISGSGVGLMSVGNAYSGTNPSRTLVERRCPG